MVSSNFCGYFAPANSADWGFQVPSIAWKSGSASPRANGAARARNNIETRHERFMDVLSQNAKVCTKKQFETLRDLRRPPRQRLDGEAAIDIELGPADFERMRSENLH